MSCKDDILDEELNDNIINEIKETEEKIHILENPEEIDFKSNLDETTMKEMFDKIRSMPKDNIAKLMTNIGQNNHIDENYNFKSFSDKNINSSKQKLTNKLNKLKSNLKPIINENDNDDNDDIKSNGDNEETLSKSQKKRLRHKKRRNSLQTQDQENLA